MKPVGRSMLKSTMRSVWPSSVSTICSIALGVPILFAIMASKMPINFVYAVAYVVGTDSVNQALGTNSTLANDV